MNQTIHNTRIFKSNTGFYVIRNIYDKENITIAPVEELTPEENSIFVMQTAMDCANMFQDLVALGVYQNAAGDINFDAENAELNIRIKAVNASTLQSEEESK